MRTIVFLGAIALARAGEVTVLTEKTFDSTVYESGKSVFVRARSRAPPLPAAGHSDCPLLAQPSGRGGARTRG